MFAALRSNDLIWPYVVNGYLKGKPPPAFDLLYWNSDGTNLPGPMFCWYLRNTYLENKLREPGATTQLGEPMDLAAIDVPTFVYASKEDHIVPWKAAYESTQLLGGDVVFVLGASGHIAGVINPPAKNKRNYWVGDGEHGGFDADPDRWLDAAEKVAGQLVARLVRVAGPARGQQGQRPQDAGQRRVHRDRARARQLRQSQGGVAE